MSTQIGVDIQQQVAHYLAGELPFVAFDEWVAMTVWDIEASADPEAERLVYEIYGRLAELSRGHPSEAELRAALQPRA